MPFVDADKWAREATGSDAALADIADGRDLSPAFRVFVIDDGVEVELEQDITGHILGIEIELNSNMVSKCAITIENRGGAFSDSGIFMPGTDIDIFLGYGDFLRKIGRWEVVRFLPQFSEDGVETLTVEGYDLGHRMITRKTDVKGGDPKKPKKGEEGGKQWGNDSNPLTLGAIVEEIATRYGAEVHMSDKDKEIEEAFIQKKGTSDFEVLMNLSRVHGLDFWIDHDSFPGAGWIIHMIDGSQVIKTNVQYTFEYGGPRGVVMSCDLEYGLPDTPSEIKAWVWDPNANGGFGDWAEIFEEETKEGKKQKKQFENGYFSDPWDNDLLGADPDDADQATDMTKFRLAVGGYAVDVLTKPFKDQKTAKAYLARWFNERKNHFIVASVRIPGVETLKPGQKHQIAGIGRRFSGTYYISDVFHTFNESGFTSEFKCRKVVEPLPSDVAEVVGVGPFAQGVA